ncbi:MAG: hypothetical protein FJ117_05315 [Deltaproteobacteria bacterium]|nr:hypothetical protein [Deltaproteobacteria bacterium]
MQKRDIFTAVCMLLIGGFIYYDSLKFPMPVEYLKFGGGAASYPRLLAVILIILAVLLLKESRALLKARRGTEEAVSPRVRDLISGSLTFILILSLAYSYIIDFIGFRLGTFLFLMAAIFKLKGAKPALSSVLSVVGLSAVATGVIYALFHLLVRVPFPVGKIFGG